MHAQAILDEIKPLGRESYRKVLLKHGVAGPCYGVKIEDLKKIQKRIRKDYRLALDLYDTGIYDAMYLAGLIADEARMTKEDLQRWVEKASGGALSGSTVPGIAADGPHGWELAVQWIESKTDAIAVAGWSTLSLWMAVKPDAQLDIPALKKLLERVRRDIHQAPNDVRYAMNGFVISAAAYIQPLTPFAMEVAESIGRVEVDMGDTACQVPYAPEYIRKIEARGTVGKKRKSARC